MEEAIQILVKFGMTPEEAEKDFNERCAYLMRGHNGTSRRYAEELVIDEIFELDTLPAASSR